LAPRWLDRRKTLGPDGRRRLFCTLDGRPPSPCHVRALLPRLACKAGIDERVHPHGLRRTMSCELMMEGVPVPIMQRRFGHASLATTQRCLATSPPRT
jgi:site-specific recombinase XerD